MSIHISYNKSTGLINHEDTTLDSFNDFDPPRIFSTGARRDTENGKLRFHAALSPYALEAYVDFMRRHNNQAHRFEENWKLGIPLDSFFGSEFRHFHTQWKKHEEKICDHELIDAVCGVIFNAMGYLHELVKPHPQTIKNDHFGKKRNRRHSKSSNGAL